MRYPANRKLETRTRIVAAASRGFRDRGLAGLSVASLMAELGLTHGGFYAHFGGKDALVIAASRRALADAWKGLEPTGAGEQVVRNIARAYLSMAHRQGRACGCPIAALGPELARSAPAIRRAVGRDILGRLTRLGAHMPGGTPRRRQDAATLLVGSLVGALLLSRLLPEREGRRCLVVTRRLIGSLANQAGAATPKGKPASSRGAGLARPLTSSARQSGRIPSKGGRERRLSS